MEEIFLKQLMQVLKRIDSKGYKAYKSLLGRYKYSHFEMAIDYVQGDPFASPSKVRILIPKSSRSIKHEWLKHPHRKVATEDILARAVGVAVHDESTIIKGSGKSGMIHFDMPGQEVLERSAVQVSSEMITICLSIGLPANGRKINGKEAEKLFLLKLPEIMKRSIFNITDAQIEKAVRVADQQAAIREEMRKNGWIAFIANGAILPRESGVSNRPLKHAVPFQSPVENEVSISIPHQDKPITGMAIRKGITLIVGGGYHGKSTMLEAIERGVYNHVAGDGREFVLTDERAVKIRAEDGRQISNVNISPFINNLPHQQDTVNFSTENASGSTSQAANVMEALEVGANVLLIDEDTSATNFMIRDFRMQQLVTPDKEPITPFIGNIKQLHDQLGVSTILVMGGSSDYFAVADTVIMLDAYIPYNVTAKAKEILKQYPLERNNQAKVEFTPQIKRLFLPASLQTWKGKRSKTQAKGLTKIIMGSHEINFAYTEQIIDPSQTRMIAEIIQYLDRTHSLGSKPLCLLLDDIERLMDEEGMTAFSLSPNQHPGDLARPRRFEIAAVFNRMLTAKVKQITK